MSRVTPSTAILLLSVVILASSTANAHNITRILERFPNFSQFNSLLTQTKLAGEINSRSTITVLAVADGKLGDLSGKTEDVQKRILSNHVVLDYFDMLKLNKLKDTRTVITTLYQSTGIADDQQGFLNVIHKKERPIVFGSAMRGAPIDAQLEGSVMTQPYNISVLSISHIIVAPGIDGTLVPVSAPPPRETAPPPAENVTSPAESPEEVVAEVPTPSEAPADAPTADAPADAPAASAAADADSPHASAGSKMVYTVSLGFIVALASFLAAH